MYLREGGVEKLETKRNFFRGFIAQIKRNAVEAGIQYEIEEHTEYVDYAVETDSRKAFAKIIQENVLAANELIESKTYDFEITFDETETFLRVRCN